LEDWRTISKRRQIRVIAVYDFTLPFASLECVADLQSEIALSVVVIQMSIRNSISFFKRAGKV